MNEIAVAGPLAHRPKNHPQVASGAIGVLLVNLGTPDATDAKSVRRYLREFLHDKRVIEEDTITWKFVLNAIILPLRPARKAGDEHLDRPQYARVSRERFAVSNGIR